MSSRIIQNASSEGTLYQAARDNNITNNIINIQNELINTYIYEDDIKEVILFFNKLSEINNINDFPNNKSIPIEEKNEINNLDTDYFINIICESSLPKFGKIRQFLSNQKNSKYVDMYNTSADEFNNYLLSIKSIYPEFSQRLYLLYSKLVDSCKKDKEFMPNRTSILLFLHFMYYNCDIGIKTDKEKELGKNNK